LLVGQFALQIASEFAVGKLHAHMAPQTGPECYAGCGTAILGGNARLTKCCIFAGCCFHCDCILPQSEKLCQVPKNRIAGLPWKQWHPCRNFGFEGFFVQHQGVA
jgi:hypothetical protein